MIILPSERAAERRRRELFATAKESCILGETVFSLPHFLKTVSFAVQPILKRSQQKHLIHSCLKQAPLKYFEKSKQAPAMAGVFLNGIRTLKRAGVSPETLQGILKESGTLKEYDLLKIFEAYEELKEKLKVSDEEDQYFEAQKNLKQKDHPFHNVQKITFENFFEIPPALKQFLEVASKTYRNLQIEITPIKEVNPATLQNVSCLSFASPHQETNWFLYRLEEWFEKRISIHEIGILKNNDAKTMERIWNKFERIGIVNGRSPFLSFKEQPEGRELLQKAFQIDGKEAPLNQWATQMKEKLSFDHSLRDLLESLNFLDHILNLGSLNKREWLNTLEEALEETTRLEIPDALSNIQWVDLGEGDTPSLKILWVPNLLEGNLTTPSQELFFQEAKDRGLPEWKVLKEAFLDPQTHFEKQRKEFLEQLSKVEETSYLTTPRLDSFGKNTSTSSFFWDFNEQEAVGEITPPIFGEEDKTLHTMQRRLKIEQERIQDHLQTKSFHTNFEGKDFEALLEPQKEDYPFSPSQLEKYAQCPFKYFSQRVLNIPEVKDCLPDVDFQDRGDLFHQCMERIYRQPPLDPAKIVEKVFAENLEKTSYANPELYERLQQKTLSQILKVMEAEKEEATHLERPLKPSYFEWDFSLPVETREKIFIKGRIDRIDVDPEKNRFLIVDYKTGDTDGFKRDLLNGLALQLPLYILAAKKILFQNYQPVGGLLISVKEIKKQHGLVDEEFNKTHFDLRKNAQALFSSKEFEGRLEKVLRQISEYVQKIREGFFSAQPKDCKVYCDYKEICRYANKPYE